MAVMLDGLNSETTRSSEELKVGVRAQSVTKAQGSIQDKELQ